MRAAALAAAARALAPGGVALVTYNALPGWHLLQPARELARLRAEGASDAEAAARRARERITMARELHGSGDAYAAALELAAARYADTPDGVLFHDDLAELTEPLRLADVLAAAPSGLNYVGEALPAHWWRHRLPPAAAERVAAAGDGPFERQQLADYASGVLFKATVLAPGAGELEIDPTRVFELSATSAPGEAREGEPPVLAALVQTLAERAPAALPVRELAASAGASEESVALAVIRLAAEERCTLWLEAPEFAREAGPLPVASPLARAQAARGGDVSSLDHRTVGFDDPLGHRLIGLLDGTRDRASLAAGLGVSNVGAALDAVAAQALLTA